MHNTEMKSKKKFQTSHIIINDHMYDLSDPNLEYLSQSIEMEYFLTKICKNLLDAYFSVPTSQGNHEAIYQYQFILYKVTFLSWYKQINDMIVANYPSKIDIKNSFE